MSLNNWINNTESTKDFFCTETIKNPYLIKNMEDYLHVHTNEDGQFNWTYNWQRKRLEKLKITLQEMYSKQSDPIEYLYFLYHHEQIDYRDISQKLNEIGHNFPHRTLANMFKKTFKWQSRKKHEETPWKLKKNIAQASPNWIWWLATINKNRIEETKNKVIEIITKSSWVNFSLEEYNLKRFKIDKLAYIFFSFWIIKEDHRSNFIELLKELNKKFWERRILNIISEIIDNSELDINIIINHKEIWYWVNK